MKFVDDDDDDDKSSAQLCHQAFLEQLQCF